MDYYQTDCLLRCLVQLEHLCLSPLLSLSRIKHRSVNCGCKVGELQLAIKNMPKTKYPPSCLIYFISSEKHCEKRSENLSVFVNRCAPDFQCLPPQLKDLLTSIREEGVQVRR